MVLYSVLFYICDPFLIYNNFFTIYLVTISSSVVFLHRVQVCYNLPGPLLLEAKVFFFSITNNMWWILTHIVPTHLSDYLSRIKSWNWNICSSGKYNLKTYAYWQIAIQENCTAVYSHQQCTTVPIFPPVQMDTVSFPNCGCCILGCPDKLIGLCLQTSVVPLLTLSSPFRMISPSFAWLILLIC